MSNFAADRLLSASANGEGDSSSAAAFRSEETVAAHVSLAEALLQIQDQTSARVEIDRALAIDPTSADALALKAKIGG
jgi:Tfp pilus assembly protein PilF